MKETIDNYLKQNWDRIQLLRDDKSFTWKTVCDALNISDTYKEYVRGRFKEIARKKKPVKKQVQFTDYKEQRSEDGSVKIEETIKSRLTDEEVFKRYNRSSLEWKITMIWFKDAMEGVKISVCFAPIKKELEAFNFQREFKEFVKTLKPAEKIDIRDIKPKPISACLLLPRQDIHFNKLDIHGNNNIEKRFNEIEKVTAQVINSALLQHKLDTIVYIIGSDEFNSEWTSQTTKGTPQQNILSYQESFKKICEFEVRTITNLASISSVDIVFIPGNHDEFVGWHLAHFLEWHFKDTPHIKINTLVDNSKVYKYNNTLILLNHGDAIKPRDLAAKFPMIAKDQWSQCDHHYIFTGDKHHELSHDFGGIMFYQIPQLSKSISKWDDKQGYITSKAEMTSFLFSKTGGLTSIFRHKL